MKKIIIIAIALIGLNSCTDAEKSKMYGYGKDYKIEMYPASHHGFHNDSTARYNKETAELAWQRTLAFFRQHLA